MPVSLWVLPVLVMSSGAIGTGPQSTNEDLNSYRDGEARKAAIVRQIGTKDLLDYSRFLLAELDKLDGPEVMGAIEVFLRSGHPERLVPAARRLVSLKPLPWGLLTIEDFFCHNRCWDAYGILLTRVRGTYTGCLELYLQHLRKSAGKEAEEAWLKAQFSSNWDFYHSAYYRLLAENGRLRPLLEDAKASILRQPDDFQRVRVYLAMFDAINQAEDSRRRDLQDSSLPQPEPSPPIDISWLARVSRSQGVMDNRTLASALREAGHLESCIEVLERCRSMQVTVADRQIIRQSSSMRGSDRIWDLSVMRMVSRDLASAYRSAGRTDEARTLAEEANPNRTNAPVEPVKIGDPNSVYDWLIKANSHEARNEFRMAQEAYEEALSRLPQDSDRRSYILSRLARLLFQQNSSAEAEKMLRQELSRPSLPEPDRDTIRLTLFAALENGQVKMGLDDPDLRSFLKTSRISPTGTNLFVFTKYLLSMSPSDQRATASQQLVSLAEEASTPDLAFELARTFEDWQLREKVLLIALDHSQSKDQRNRACGELFELYMERKMWKLAEASIASANTGLQISTESFQRLAIAAAESHELDHAMRFWKARIAQDLSRADGCVSTLARLGLREELNKLYRQLGSRDPGNEYVNSALAALEPQLPKMLRTPTNHTP